MLAVSCLLLPQSFCGAVTQPSKHLWLGNIPMRPDKAAIEYLFGSFGHVTSVRVFPGKTFAFVNFETAQEAEYAMKCLDGLHWPAVSGLFSQNDHGNTS